MSARKKAKAAEPPADRNGTEAKVALDLFHELHLARFGFKPIISGGKDMTLLKKLVAAWGLADVERLMRLFFDPLTRDYRVVTSNFDVGAFYALAPHLQRLERRAGPPDRRTAGNLDAAARAMRPRGGERDGRLD